MQNKHEEVQKYYSETLQKSEDLKTNACCTMDAPPSYIKEVLEQIHPEVLAKYYGCGLTIPTELNNLKILDLGSGSGRDCFIASKLVGENGKVVGLDMTKSQLEIARKYESFHQEAFGFQQPNTEFIEGNIEVLDQLNLKKASFDLLISNCVINLAQNKEKVLKDAFHLLKEGGEMYFSDVYANRRIPEKLKADEVLWGECLSGALYWNDFLNLAKKAGFTDPRAVDFSPIEINNPVLEKKIGNIQFYSVTYRLFKIKGLESDCEDYGQAVCYKGTIAHSENELVLDQHHIFEKGKIEAVCGNTFKMLQETRFKKHFEFYGDFSTHFGIFEGCGVNMPFQENTTAPDNSSSCC